MQNPGPGLRFLQFPAAERGGKDWMRIAKGDRFRSNGKHREVSQIVSGFGKTA